MTELLEDIDINLGMLDNLEPKRHIVPVNKQTGALEEIALCGYRTSLVDPNLLHRFKTCVTCEQILRERYM